MTTTVRIHNPVPEPLIFTSDGRQIDGNASAHGTLTDRLTKSLVECGRLIIPTSGDEPATEPKTRTKKEAATNE